MPHRPPPGPKTDPKTIKIPAGSAVPNRSRADDDPFAIQKPVWKRVTTGVYPVLTNGDLVIGVTHSDKSIPDWYGFVPPDAIFIQNPRMQYPALFRATDVPLEDLLWLLESRKAVDSVTRRKPG
jgi:hypothetical protein